MGFAFCIQQNVSRLNVAMENSVFMRVMNGACNLRDQFHRAPNRHWLAPCHFVDGAPGLDDIPLGHLVGPTQVIHLDSVRDDEAIGPERLPIIKDPRVLMSTGWWRHADDPDRYFTRYPYLTLDAAAVLINSGVRLVGIDGPSVDRDGETHKEFLSRGVVIVENLISLDKLPETCTVWILPLPIAGGDGSPVRAVAEVALPG